MNSKKKQSIFQLIRFQNYMYRQQNKSLAKKLNKNNKYYS